MKPGDLIYIIIHSLKYEADPSQAQTITRAQFERLRKEQKGQYNKRANTLTVRLSPRKWLEKAREIDREANRTAYDKAIMKKYNVGSDYRQNRYFMEQVRPTIN